MVQKVLVPYKSRFHRETAIPRLLSGIHLRFDRSRLCTLLLCGFTVRGLSRPAASITTNFRDSLLLVSYSCSPVNFFPTGIQIVSQLTSLVSNWHPVCARKVRSSRKRSYTNDYRNAMSAMARYVLRYEFQGGKFLENHRIVEKV